MYIAHSIAQIWNYKRRYVPSTFYLNVKSSVFLKRVLVNTNRSCTIHVPVSMSEISEGGSSGCISKKSSPQRGKEAQSTTANSKWRRKYSEQRYEVYARTTTTTYSLSKYKLGKNPTETGRYMLTYHMCVYISNLYLHIYTYIYRFLYGIYGISFTKWKMIDGQSQCRSCRLGERLHLLTCFCMLQISDTAGFPHFADANDARGLKEVLASSN